MSQDVTHTCDRFRVVSTSGRTVGALWRGGRWRRCDSTDVSDALGGRWGLFHFDEGFGAEVDAVDRVCSGDESSVDRQGAPRRAAGMASDESDETGVSGDASGGRNEVVWCVGAREEFGVDVSSEHDGCSAFADREEPFGKKLLTSVLKRTEAWSTWTFDVEHVGLDVGACVGQLAKLLDQPQHRQRGATVLALPGRRRQHVRPVVDGPIRPDVVREPCLAPAVANRETRAGNSLVPCRSPTITRAAS